jgi:hypothetical protein
MKKIIPCVAVIGACVALGACTSPAGQHTFPPGQPAPTFHRQGEPWTVNGATYTVDWTVRPTGYEGRPRPYLEIGVRVDNRGNSVAHFPDPSVVYAGDAVAFAGWTQPLAGADVPSGQTGDFSSAFGLTHPGGTLQVRVSAYVGTVQALGYWTGTAG